MHFDSQRAALLDRLKRRHALPTVKEVLPKTLAPVEIAVIPKAATKKEGVSSPPPSAAPASKPKGKGK
jgi:hypothetical protein